MKRLSACRPLIRAWAVGWTFFALRRLRRDIPTQGLDVRVQSPSIASPNGVRAVAFALKAQRATCLERSLVLQQWLASSGRPYEVLIGVASGASVEAHAWIDRYDPEDEGQHFEVLARVAPRE